MPNALDETLSGMQQGGAAPAGNALDQTLAGLSAPAAAPSAPLPWWQRVAKGVSDVNDAGAQMLVNALPPGLVNSVNSATKAVNDLPVIGPITKALNMTPATAQQVNDTISSNEKAYQERRGSSGIDWPRMLGNAAVTTPLAPYMAAPGVAGGAAAGALYGGISSPVTDGDYAGGKLQQIGLGAGFGGGTAALGNTLAKVISPSVNGDVKTLMDAGVTMTPGQIMGGTLKRLEDGATSIPVVGDMIKNAQRRSFQDLNTAAINRSLAPIGQSLPPGVAGRQAIEQAGTMLGSHYDAVLGKMGAIHPDAQFGSDLASLGAMTQNLPAATADQFQRIVKNEILGRIDAHGVMTPQGMKSAESNIGAAASGYLKDQNYDTRELGKALQEAQSTLRSMVQRVSPDHAPELQAANEGWANFLRTQRAASSLGAEGGMFTPAQLQNAVKAMDSSRSKGAFARGDALMQDLSEAGKNVMGNTVPDSGTPFRHLATTGLGAVAGHAMLPPGMAAAIPAIAAGGAALAAPYTSLGQKLAQSLMTQRPGFAPALADQVRALTPFLVPAAVSGSK